MEFKELNLEEIGKQAIKNAISEITRNYVKNFIAKNIGYGCDKDIKDMLKEEVRNILKTEEFQTKIKEKLVYWIKEN